MKSGLNQSDQKFEVEFCSMCGAKRGDFWETLPTRAIQIKLRSRYGDIGQKWMLYDECYQGLQDLKKQRGRVGAASSGIAN